MKIKHFAQNTCSLRAVTLLLIALLITGCSKPIEEEIIGKWKDDRGYIEFFQDYTYIMFDGNKQFSGRWTKAGDDRIKGEFTVIGTTAILMFENINVSGDKMSLSINGSSPATLTRDK